MAHTHQPDQLSQRDFARERRKVEDLFEASFTELRYRWRALIVWVVNNSQGEIRFTDEWFETGTVMSS